MNSLNLFAWICMLLAGPSGKQVSIVHCNREYIAKLAKVYLKDEGIEATMMQVLEKKTKKFAYGYFVKAVRNDTNFIYSRLYQKGDTLIQVTYRQYHITYGLDSTIARFTCTKEGLKLYSHKSYWNGTMKSESFFQ